MKWLTQQQIRAAAEKGVDSALDCSIKHWWQISTASAKELCRAIDKNQVSYTDLGCALCHWCLSIAGDEKNPCEVMDCPAGPVCEGVYQEARDALRSWHTWPEPEFTHKEVKAVCRKVHRELKKIQAERKKK